MPVAPQQQAFWNLDGRVDSAFLRNARAVDDGYAGNSDCLIVNDPGHADALFFVSYDAFQHEEQHSLQSNPESTSGKNYSAV
jgi:hypothetical protein